MLRLIKVLWYGLFISFHISIAKRMNRNTQIGRIKSNYRYNLASYYYEKAYGHKFVRKQSEGD